jgi:hypothetical protein
MLLDMGHTLRGVHIQEELGYVGNPKLESVSCPHCRGTNTVSDQVVIHLFMEAMLGISLYSYPYLN